MILLEANDQRITINQQEILCANKGYQKQLRLAAQLQLETNTTYLPDVDLFIAQGIIEDTGGRILSRVSPPEPDIPIENRPIIY